jgi:AAT family amino acid transporter/lysine-specific permease
MLWSMAKDGQAPKFLQNVNDRGIPMNALVVTTVVGGLGFLTSIFGDQVYTWLLNASGLTGFIAWLGIAVSHYRFRKAYIAQGRNIDDLKFKAKWFPFGPILAFLMCVIVMVGQNYQAFIASKIDWYGVAVTYIGLPIFLVLWLGYKLVHKTKVLSLKECSFEEMSSK